MDKMIGKVWVLGDDIDTDIIIPTEYLALKTIDDMKQYGFSPLRPELAAQIKPGDIIVAGKNFGCGSSREQAPEIIKALGVQCVIAKSFARIFFRNSINNGLLLIEQPTPHFSFLIQTIQFAHSLYQTSCADNAHQVLWKRGDWVCFSIVIHMFVHYNRDGISLFDVIIECVRNGKDSN